MYVVRIEQQVPNFGAWKAAFDSDPLNRDQAGVLHYRILRSVEDPDDVMVDLAFDSLDKAHAFGAALRQLWQRIEPEGLVASPQLRLVDVVEGRNYP